MKQSTYRKIYSQSYDIGTDQSEIIGLYLELWERLGRPNPVLEPMCGTGLNLLPLIEAGSDIDGVDSSPYMLAICREKCEAKGLSCNLYEQFLEQMIMPRRYNFIFIPGGSYGHIYDLQVVAESLKRIYEHLLPGGWFALEVRSPAFLKNMGAHGQVDYGLNEYPDGATVFTTAMWQHLEGGKIIRNWTKFERYVNDKLTETEVFDYRERLYHQDEMESVLKASGFGEIRVTKAYTHDVAPTEQDAMTFLCQRA